MRSTRAFIHTENFRDNIRLVREQVGPERLICAAVKADAYGHGAVEMARFAAEEGVERFAVAAVEEGEILREKGIEQPILILSLVTPDEVSDLIKADLQPLVADAAYIEQLNRESSRLGRIVRVHVHVDTGMGRIGCAPEDAAALAAYISSLDSVKLEGMSTHFACADSSDRTFTEKQLSQFKAAVNSVKARGLNPGIVHASNSAAIMEYPESWIDMVRPGIMLYGYYPGKETERKLPLKPVMELRSKVVFLKQVPAGQTLSYGATYVTERDTVVATIPVGYGDGYNRLLSSKGEVLIRGKRYTVSGRVTMDQCVVDLGKNTDVRLYDDVILFGPDPAGLNAEDIADLTGTISYEVTCAINKRVPRIYV